jgi:hypothetical protein
MFAVAMAFVESAVVVYLRALYYPETFLHFVNFSPQIYTVELLREASTIVMLVAVALLAFRKAKMQVLTFFWLFAIWDLFYYLFLKLILNWPASLTDTDIFFLIPVPWLGPVWLPVLLSAIVLILTSYLFLRKANKSSILGS